MLLQPEDHILFQGDSITDAGRDFHKNEPNRANGLGGGYAHLVAATLHNEYIAMNLRFSNRGVAGNVVQQMLDRWQTDCLDIKPDVLSVLLGVNDTARPIKGKPGADTVENFDLKYRQCLDAARQVNPKLRIILCEPFLQVCAEVTEAYLPGLEARQQIVRKLAEDYDALFVPFQSLFDAMLDDAPAEYWLPDGVHPAPAAHYRMAAMWIDRVTGSQSGRG